MSLTTSEKMLHQITATLRNITVHEVTSKIVRIVPDSMERVTSGVSRFLLINTEKYASFVSSLEEGDSFLFQLIGLTGYKIYSNSDAIFMYIHLILGALFPIFIGAHASLSRPSSAGKKARDSKGDEGNEEHEPLEKAMDTLDKTDAILFPIVAGILLTGLYFLIKWLEDPALLNKIMGWYFSLIGIGATGMLTADTLNVLTTFIFPSRYFSKGEIYHIDPLLSQQFLDIRGKTDRATLHRKFQSEKSTPLPLPYNSQLWALRSLFTERWLFKGYVHGITSFKSYVRLNDAIGMVLGAVAIAFYNFAGKPWFITNFLGVSFCYTALQLFSPTTFSTGSLLLIGLFFYDITMVFYTPMMKTVALSLDVPIKLVFPGPKRGSMLGLGDVVLPGVMLALALRFDLYMYYLRKQARATDSKLLPDGLESRRSAYPDGQVIKAPYVDVTGQWGERFWTIGAPKQERPETFPKVYFIAGILGYVSGLLFTLLSLVVFKHAQPALLYLVPGVLISIWGTAAFRGEIPLMLSYDEASQSGDPSERRGNKSDKGRRSATEIKRQEEQDHAHHVFLFSLTTPRNLNRVSGAKAI